MVNHGLSSEALSILDSWLASSSSWGLFQGVSWCSLVNFRVAATFWNTSYVPTQLLLRYFAYVTANSVTGPDNPWNNRRSSVSSTMPTLFLRPHIRVMAAVRGRPSGLPGSYCPGLSACAQLPPFRLITNVAASRH